MFYNRAKKEHDMNKVREALKFIKEIIDASDLINIFEIEDTETVKDIELAIINAFINSK